MATEVLPSVTSLSEQLVQAKEKLKETEENIKKATGRDTIEPLRPPGSMRRLDYPPPATLIRNSSTIRTPSFVRENPSFPRDAKPLDEPLTKRPRAMISFHPVVPDNPSNPPERRRGGWDDDDDYRRRKVQSTVIVDAMPTKTREERISEAQVRVGDQDVARNRRIFGSLMGTLKKFQQEQNTRAQTDERQKEIRKKLEEKEYAEKEEARQQRRELFWERQRSAAVVKFLETKVDIVQRFTDWKSCQTPLFKFIHSEGPHPVCYVPKSLNKVQEERLEKSKKLLEALIETRREFMEKQLQDLDRKIEQINGAKSRGLDVSLEDHIQETRKKMREEPVDDIDVEALLDDNEVEGLELVAVDEPVKFTGEDETKSDEKAVVAMDESTVETEVVRDEVVDMDIADDTQGPEESGEEPVVMQNGSISEENGKDSTENMVQDHDV